MGQAAAGAYLYPAALFFIAVRDYSINNSLFEVGDVVTFGVIGAVFAVLDFPAAPILLGHVLGPMVEENFRRALLLSWSDLLVFLKRPISATIGASFMTVCVLLILTQLFSSLRASTHNKETRARPGVVRVEGG